MSEYRQCPFDPLHKIAAKTFALHLVKCKRQHPDVKLVKCHFDTSHLVKEEDLRDHMKTCSGRKELLQYKITVNRTATNIQDKLPDPAEDLIYYTPDASKEKITDGITLQDDSECWDDFAYKAYDPLENCKSKLKNGKPFIIPNANKFVGQMQDAAALKEDQSKGVRESQDQDVETESSEKKQHEDGDESSGHRSVKQERRDYESESAGYSSSSKKQKYRDRNDGASSSTRRYEAHGDTRHPKRTEERSHRNRDRSRSDSSSDRKSHGYTYHRSYDSSHSRHRRDRHKPDGSRKDYDRHTDSDTSVRSHDSNKHKLQAYQQHY